MKKFEELVSYDFSLHLLSQQKWRGIGEFYVDALKSRGLISASEIVSSVDVPSSNRSAVDGYALLSKHTAGASSSDPVLFKNVGTAYPGSPFTGNLEKGQCVEIYTGASVPDGTDSVVMAEDVNLKEDSVEISSPALPGLNIIRKGEDIGKGQIILHQYDVIMPWHIAALLANGIKAVRVYRKVRIGIIPTGNELFPDSEEMVENTTPAAISSILRNTFFQTLVFPPIHDNTDEISRTVSLNLSRVDMLIISGGSSLGMMDNVPEAMGTLKAKTVFGGVRTSPGRTTAVYSLNGKMILSVSGFPMTAMIMSDLYVENMLKILFHMKNYRVLAEMMVDKSVNGKPGYMKLVPASIVPGEDRKVHPLGSRHGIKISHMIGSDCLIIIPENVEGYKEGDNVLCRLW